MENIIIWGASYHGSIAHEELKKEGYQAIAFGDNNSFKIGSTLYGLPIVGLRECSTMFASTPIIVAVGNTKYIEVAEMLLNAGLTLKGIFNSSLKQLQLYNHLSFADLEKFSYIHLYAGDIPKRLDYLNKNIVGLSLTNTDERTIKHDITLPYPLKDNSIDAYQAEDVFEHIAYDKLPAVIDEIYRILKPGGYFRLSVPDYRNETLQFRSLKKYGAIIFDPIGGGTLSSDGTISNGGHLWFPSYENVSSLLNISNFNSFSFLHCYDNTNSEIRHVIDYSKGYIQRTPENTNTDHVISLVVDCYKR